MTRYQRSDYHVAHRLRTDVKVTNGEFLHSKWCSGVFIEWTIETRLEMQADIAAN